MKKLLIVSPHFSTGGAPQVTLNKVELLKDHFDIVVVEYAFLAWNYVVQRNKVIDILGNNFISLGEDKLSAMRDVIEGFQPDVISMEEFPEMFMDDSVTRMVYDINREYDIVETTHDSSFNPKHKRWMPDEFVFVSSYNSFKYIDLPVPMHVIEYPVDLETKEPSKDNTKHVSIVGLWTQRKNQGYAIELAKELVDYNIKFHFYGNQAGNFESYWKPLMEDLPANCVIEGEVTNVTERVKNSDLFLFPSKGDRGNKELNPIAIKEALKYPELPKLMYNLDVYCNKYNDYDDVFYLTGNVETDVATMKDVLGLKAISKELIVIGTYPNTSIRQQLTVDCIAAASELGRPIMLVSHYPVDKDIQDLVDYYVYDRHNPLTHHSYYNQFTRNTDEISVKMRIEGNSNQSLTVLTNLVNGAKAAKSFGFTKMCYMTFDIIIDPQDHHEIEKGFAKIDGDWKARLATLNTPFGKGVSTNCMFFDTSFVTKLIDDVREPEEYNALCESIGSQNFLEDYMIKKVNKTKGVWVEHPEDLTFLKHTGDGKSSNSEYIGILNYERWDTKYFYFYTYNEDLTQYTVDEYNKEGKLVYTHSFKEREKCLAISDEVYRVELIAADNSSMRVYFADKLSGTIVLREEEQFVPGYNKPRPKIKLVHIQTTLNDEREKQSRRSLEEVRDYGWEYIIHTNVPYSSLPPSHNCNRPQAVSMELFNEDEVKRRGTALTPAHYGCYLAFKEAILAEFNDCDYLIVCEGDCLIEGDVETFIHKVEKCALMLDKSNIKFMSFGDKDTLEYGWPQSPVVEEVNEDMYVTDHLIGLQCIMFPASIANGLKHLLRTEKWDAADMYFNIIFQNRNMGIVYNRLTTQADGYSLIDKQHKQFRK
jgi:glycosyltransferase involved in cell wall biosynthesis